MVSFTFEPGVRLSEGMRRQMRRQLRGASRALAGPEITAEAIHRARRCLKRARSLTVLLKAASATSAWADEDRAIRDAGRALAGARDVKAKLDALAKLEAWAADAGEAQAFMRVRRGLERTRTARERDVEGSAAAEVAAGLVALCRQFTRKRLRGMGTTATIAGVVKTYRRGRQAMQEAYRTGTDEDFHEWRKHLQRHWRHMQLFAPAWPAEINVRVAGARELSELLGDDHDLHLLQLYLAAQPVTLARVKRERLAELCASLQAEMKGRARVIGARLYAERSRSFGARLKAYWTQACLQAPPVARAGVATAAGADVSEPAALT